MKRILIVFLTAFSINPLVFFSSYPQTPTVSPTPDSRYMRATYLCYTNLGSTGSYGDAVYYEFPGEDGTLDTDDDKNLLFDGGYSTKDTEAVAKFLDEKIGVGGTIYYMVLSSPGADHWYGLEMAVERYNVLNYYENVRWPDKYDALINAIEAEGCNVYYYDAGHYLSGPDTTLGPSWGEWSGWDPYIEAKVLCANANPPGANDNYWAGVIQFRCGDSVFIQGGDADSNYQEKWIENETSPHSYTGASSELADTDFYKVHHHGSYLSSSPSFMNQMSPGYAVVTVAHKSTAASGHPRREALDWINDSGAIVYRVDLDHHVTVRCDNRDNYEITRSMVWSRQTDKRYTPTAANYYASGADEALHFSPPPLVSGLGVEEQTKEHVVLSWNACTTPDTTYNVYRSTDHNGDSGGGRAVNPGVGEATGIYEKLTDSSIAYTTYTDDDCIKGMTYYYRVASLQENSESDYSVTYERRWSNEVGAVSGFTPSPTPEGYHTPSPTPTMTPTPSSTPTCTPTASVTPTPEGYHTVTPTPTSAATSTPTPTPGHLDWFLQTDIGSPYLYCVKALDANNVWTAGQYGIIYFYNGLKWAEQEDVGDIYIRGIDAIDATNAWAVGDYGEIYYFDGNSWELQTDVGATTLYSIAALDNSHVWAGGSSGKVYFYDGGEWTEEDDLGTAYVRSICALAPDKTWAIHGSSSEVHFFDGSSWALQTDFGDVYLYGISGFMTGALVPKLWVAGEDGYIYHYDGSNWLVQTHAEGIDWDGVDALDGNRVWAVGDNIIGRYNGSSWSEESDIGLYRYLYGVSAASGDRVWAVGFSGRIYSTYPVFTPTPVGYKTPNPSPTPTLTPESYKTPTCTPTPTVTPHHLDWFLQTDVGDASLYCVKEIGRASCRERV